jgi:hypothetical protein
MINTYILAKNESPNIGKCCARFAGRSTAVVVLDSGSTDDTTAIASTVCGAMVRPFTYTNHADAYNEITGLTPADGWALVLDADMEVSDQLWAELSEAARLTTVDVIRAPVVMYTEGLEMRSGSLYPLKPILFRGGRAHMVPRGHGETLAPDTRVAQTTHKLIHNDLKPYGVYLSSQVRYAENLMSRNFAGGISWLDRIRVRTPILAIAVPIYSLVFRGGWRAGKLGVIYAIDRSIAELIQFRQAVARRLPKD